MGGVEKKPNIFDEIARQRAKERKKEKKKRTSHKKIESFSSPLDRPLKEEGPSSTKEETSESHSIQEIDPQSIPSEFKPTDPETKEIIDKIQKMREELDQKIDYLLNYKDVLPEPFGLMLDDMKNLPEGAQTEILEKANDLVKYVNSIIGTGSVETLSKKKEKKEAKRGMKAQKLHGKRDWISM
jgi:hypothetical protein